MQDMTNLLRFLLVITIIGISGKAYAQGQSGAIQGEVIDGEGLPAINAVITVSDATGVKGNTVTDYNGEYIIKPLNPGRYDVTVKLLGHKDSRTTGVIVSPDKTTGVNFTLQKSTNELEEVVIVEYKVPLIDKFAGGGAVTKTKEELDRMPTRNTTTMASTAPGVYSNEDGGNVNIGGGRGDGTLYIIDGVQVVGSRGINIPQGAIDQMQVLSSGIPAKYGDAIGGVVTITTRGVTDKLRGNVLLERSVDGYGHNLANVSLSGPLFSKRIDSVNKKPVVGFAISGDFWYDEDRRPYYHGNYAVKDEVLQDLQQNPIYNVPNQSGATVVRSRAENVLAEDLYITKKRQNAEIMEGRLNASLDFQLADNLTLRAGGNANYTRENLWIRSLSFFAPEAQPIETNFTGRGFLRLQQSFKNAEPQETVDGVEPKKPLISNAFYTVQLDYQYDERRREHPDHGRDPFKYGYVGKFNTQYIPIYGASVDSVTGYTGTRLIVDRLPVGTTFERSELNPVLANYTTQYYNLLGDQLPQDVSELRARGAMTNGQMPQPIYDNFYNVMGQSQTFFFNADVSQYSVSVDASFDLQPGKTRHSIEFGLYYQQRAERNYQVAAANTNGGLWQYMRQLTNTHIALDRANPIFIIDGERYTKDQVGGVNGISPSVTDTILYNRISRGDQNTFDKNLRDRLGVGTTDYIDIDALDPSTYSLDLFSADELLNSGTPYVFYSGYDYLGNKQSGQVNFNDFFTKKDADGNYTRDIGAYRPNYLAAYVLDKFQFKDILFNLGLRVDRFDANTKVLKDPYSLYEVNTLGDAKSITNSAGQRLVQNSYTEDGNDPSNIGDDYVVYVDNNESGAPGIIGYRNGDDWYDPFGRLVQDPNTLKQYSGGRDPQPYLVDSKVRITDSTFDPNSSFTDYTPQINVMPRISFSFPISDVALFYAHYDVIVQRPKGRVFARPSDYYFLTANQGGLINNPDLKPEKLFDYEVGFKQTIGERSAVTISGFYKERKDMIQVRPYLFAWPTTYYTYGNRDFSTTKGMTVRYDMRRTGNLRLDIAYTLQYVNGTASDDQGGIVSANNPSAPGLLSGFISAGLPNIRTTFPLNIDTRHMIVSTIDYRYGQGKGPVVAGSHIFQNAGANFIFRARSGEPYTKYTNPRRIANTVDGQVNGARLPWHYMVDLKVDKDFQLSFGKKDDNKVRRPLYLNAYVLVTNLFNIRDVQSVDGYTGRPDDDGYLASPQGIQATNNQLNSQSYIDLYSAYLMGIANQRINLPRRINVGLSFNF